MLLKSFMNDLQLEDNPTKDRISQSFWYGPRNYRSHLLLVRFNAVPQKEHARERISFAGKSDTCQASTSNLHGVIVEGLWTTISHADRTSCWRQSRHLYRWPTVIHERIPCWIPFPVRYVFGFPTTELMLLILVCARYTSPGSGQHRCVHLSRCWAPHRWGWANHWWNVSQTFNSIQFNARRNAFNYNYSKSSFQFKYYIVLSIRFIDSLTYSLLFSPVYSLSYTAVADRR